MKGGGGSGLKRVEGGPCSGVPFYWNMKGGFEKVVVTGGMVHCQGFHYIEI